MQSPSEIALSRLREGLLTKTAHDPDAQKAADGLMSEVI